jgi:hypothetical protein
VQPGHAPELLATGAGVLREPRLVIHVGIGPDARAGRSRAILLDAGVGGIDARVFGREDPLADSTSAAPAHVLKAAV